jgi:hypothetical protein
MANRVIRVDFYSTNGKWYTGGDVEIGPLDDFFDRADIAIRINKNQKILGCGVIDQFFAVTISGHQFGSEWLFANFLYLPGEIAGYVVGGL